MNNDSLIGKAKRLWDGFVAWVIIVGIAAVVGAVVWLLFYLDHVRFVV